MVQRALARKLIQLAGQFPIVILTGPRQSGKTTLARSAFPGYSYVSLENLDVRDFALRDPRGFLDRFRGPAIMDEVQRAPDLMSYMQTVVDEEGMPGRYILTGSQQFHLLARAGQSLAGRAAYLRLLPFSLSELTGAPFQDPGAYFAAPARAERPAAMELDEVLFRGLYPRIHDQKLEASDFLGSYVAAYIERDVREVLRIGDLMTFQRFVQLCAGRSGQELNLSSLAADAGVSHPTARSWLSVLEAGSLVHLLQPYHENFSRRVAKRPRLYFVDSGLMCHLLRIRAARELFGHPLYGAVFETFVVSEFLKAFVHRGERPPLYCWRDRSGHEVDVVLDLGRRLTAIEVKAGRTVASDAFRALARFSALAGPRAERVLVHGGAESGLREGVRIRTWWQAS